MNNFIGLGRLVKDPELRYLQSGTVVTNFTLAIERQMTKEKKDEAKRKGETTADFIPVVVWGKQAEHCSNYLSKGKLVAVLGQIQTGSYEKDGQRVYTTDVVAREVKFLEWGNSNQGQVQGQKQDPPMQQGFEKAGPNDPFPF